MEKHRARLSFTYEQLERFFKTINYLPEDGHIFSIDDIPPRGIMRINFESKYCHRRAEGAEAVSYNYPAWWVERK